MSFTVSDYTSTSLARHSNRVDLRVSATPKRGLPVSKREMARRKELSAKDERGRQPLRRDR